MDDLLKYDLFLPVSDQCLW